MLKGSNKSVRQGISQPLLCVDCGIKSGNDACESGLAARLRAQVLPSP
jgi:hypothetical protein